MELADMLALEAGALKGMGVRISLRLPEKKNDL